MIDHVVVDEPGHDAAHPGMGGWSMTVENINQVERRFNVLPAGALFLTVENVLHFKLAVSSEGASRDFEFNAVVLSNGCPIKVRPDLLVRELPNAVLRY